MNVLKLRGLNVGDLSGWVNAKHALILRDEKVDVGNLPGSVVVSQGHGARDHRDIVGLGVFFGDASLKAVAPASRLVAGELRHHRATLFVVQAEWAGVATSANDGPSVGASNTL